MPVRNFSSGAFDLVLALAALAAALALFVLI
jgi:hypothetical protein